MTPCNMEDRENTWAQKFFRGGPPLATGLMKVEEILEF